MKVKPLAYAVAAFSAATATFTWGAELTAQENAEQEQAIELDTIVVSASRMKESVASIPYTTQVVSGQDIAAQAQPGQSTGLD